LAKTPLQLEILKNAGVVDAGAQGFVYFLKGIADFITSGDVRIIQPVAFTERQKSKTVSEVDAQLFCAECQINKSLNREELESGLAKRGTQTLITGPRSRIRIHIHTADPEGFFTYCSGFGPVTRRVMIPIPNKISKHPLRKKAIAIVTDSVADFKDSKNQDVFIVPVRFNFGRKSYIDKISMTTAEFYNELQTNPVHPKTSQPAPGDFKKIYQYLFEHYKSTISIHLADVLSGTFQSARHAIEQIPGNRISLLDSSSVSVTEGLLVTAAIQAAKSGKSRKFIIEHIESLKSGTRLFAALADLSYAVKGGRVPGFVNSISKFLHLKPVLSTLENGQLKPIGVLFGNRNIPRKLCRFLLRRIDSDLPYRAIVGHSNSPELGRRMVKILKQKLPQIQEVSLIEIGGGLGVHTGPGALAVGLQEFVQIK